MRPTFIPAGTIPLRLPRKESTMKRQSAASRPQLLPLSLSCLVLLVAGTGCSRASESATAKAQGDKAAAAAPAKPAAGQTTPAPAAPGTATPAAPGAPGAPGAAPATAVKPVDPAKLPAVVARVNGQEIKKDDFLKEVKGVQARMAQQGAPADAAPPTLYHQVLDGMIARTLLENEAKTQGISVTDDEVKKQLDQTRGQFPSPEEFKKALAAEGVTEAQLQDNLKRQMAIQKYIQAKVVDASKVTDADTKTFYDQNKDKMKQPERLHLRHILVKTEKDAPAADKQKAQAKANGLMARLKKGEDFAKLATENSDDPGSKAQGGDLSWVSRGDTVPTFEQAAFALKAKNEMSPVVESPFGYHIIQLLERQDESTVPYEQVKDKITEFLKQRQAQQGVQERIQALKAKAKVETFI
jgi:parvulin-like peptidyl-prolyl isomerase